MHAGDATQTPAQEVTNADSCSCETCLHKYGDMEKDLQPEKEEVLKWHTFNYWNGEKTAAHGECYPCFANRRKKQPWHIPG